MSPIEYSVLAHMLRLGGWMTGDYVRVRGERPVRVRPRTVESTLRTLHERQWARLLVSPSGEVLAAEVTPLGRAALYWGGHARVLTSTAA